MQPEGSIQVILNWELGPRGRARNNLNLRACNLLLLGEKGSGKSALVNSIKSALLERDIREADVRPSADHVTKRIFAYPLERVPVTLYDFWGWKSNYELEAMLMVAGRIREGTEFNEVPWINDPLLESAPRFHQEMHGVLLAVSFAQHNDKLFPDVARNLKGMVERLIRYSIPVVVLLTQCDLAPDVTPLSDLSNFASSKAVVQAQQALAKSLGLEPLQVVPVSTVYGTGRVVTDALRRNARDIVLGALKVALVRCTGFYDNVAHDRVKRSNI